MQGYRVTLERLMNAFQVIRWNYVVCGWNKLNSHRNLTWPWRLFRII